MRPHLQQLPVDVEDLDPVVFAVAHIQPVFRVDADRMTHTELARAVARRAPRRDVVARGVELDDARVAVAVGHVEVALRIPRDVRGSAERLVVASDDAFRAPRLQQLAVVA